MMESSQAAVGVRASRQGHGVWRFLGVLILSVLTARVVIHLLSPLHLALEMDVDSREGGRSQVFFASDQASFTESDSISTTIPPGPSTARFDMDDLTGRIGQVMRWDPLDRPGVVVVSAIRVVSPFVSHSVPLSALRPSQDVLQWSAERGQVSVVTGSNDAQVLVSADLRAVSAKGEVIAFGYVLVLALVVACLDLLWRRNRDSRLRPQVTLSSGFIPRSNALNSIRLVLAILVIASHTTDLAGFTPEESHTGGFLGEGMVVDSFFAMSGFLMARTWARRPSWGRYLWHRFVRLFPAFWFAAVVVALVIAPASVIVAGGSLDGLFTGAGGAFSYVWSNGSLWLGQVGIRGTPTGVPVDGTWNLPIWTMGWTVTCDLALVGLGLFGLIRGRRWPVLVALAGAWGANAVMAAVGERMIAGPGALIAPGSRFLLLFLVGVALFQWHDRIPLSGLLAVAAFDAVILSEFLLEDHYRILGAIPLGYLVLWLGSRLPVRVGSRNDLSYGLYLFGWPAQQVLAMLGGVALGWWAFTATSVLIALPAAALSWFLVEKRAMRLRDWTPSWRQFLELRIWRHPRVVTAGLLAAYLTLGTAIAAHTWM